MRSSLRREWQNSLQVRWGNAKVAVREALAKVHGGLLNPEQPPKGEHACNGAVEEAGRTVRDMLRVYKLQLEIRIKHEIEVEAPIMQQMARWAAMAISRFRMGKDNRTAYERQRGKRCTEGVVRFGEKCGFDRSTILMVKRGHCKPSGKRASGEDTVESQMKPG